MHALPYEDGVSLIADTSLEIAALKRWATEGSIATLLPIGPACAMLRITFQQPPPMESPPALPTNSWMCTLPCKDIAMAASARESTQSPPPSPVPWVPVVGAYVRLRATGTPARVDLVLTHIGRNHQSIFSVNITLISDRGALPASHGGYYPSALEPWEPRLGDYVGIVGEFKQTGYVTSVRMDRGLPMRAQVQTNFGLSSYLEVADLYPALP